MSERFEVFWDWTDGGNVEHVAEHDVTPDEVDQVLERGLEDRQPNRSVPGRWIVADFTDAGRYLVVAIELEWVDELNGWLVTPITAFDPEAN